MKLLNLSLKSIVTVAVAFLFGALAALAVGVPEHAVAVGAVFAVLCFIPQGNKNAGIFNTITAADVVSEWGAYYRPEGQTINDIIKKLMQKTVTASYFPSRTTDQTVLRKVSSQFARVLQRFQKQFTPIGGTTFEPMSIQLYKLKIDLQETPDDLEETWLGFLADNDLKRQDWPFIRWYLEGAIAQAQSDMELNEIYTGVPGSITAGTATSAGASLYGIKKQINDFNTSGTLNKITLGATPTDPVDFVDYVESFFENIDQLLRMEIKEIFMNIENRNLYRDGMRTKYNTYYNQVGDNDITTLRNYPVKLIGLPSMVGSNKLWATPEWNRQRGIKKPGNASIFQVENVDRTVKAYTDWFEGYGFWIPQYVVSNDVELT